jgi:hypothetical protein
MFPSCLNTLRLPARLNVEQTASILGFGAHDIPVLVRSRLLKPLGGGVRNCVKYFAAVEVEKLSRDKQWLDKATAATGRRKANVVESSSRHSRQPISHLSAYAS